MNIDKMVSDLIKAQQEIGEPITISRKTGKADEIHNACSGAGLDLMTLQITAISELFENMANDLSSRETKAVGMALISAVTDQIQQTIDSKNAHQAPNIH